MERWQRTVLKGVLWSEIKGAVNRRTGSSSENAVQIVMPLSLEASRAAYMPPMAWAELDNKSDYWTLQSGDTVMLGELSQEISRSSELKKLDGAAVINSVDTKNYGGDMAHWEVSAK